MRRQPTALAIAALVALIVGGCSLLPSPATPNPVNVPPATAASPTVDPSSTLAQAQAAWAAAGIHDYTWVIGYSCECAGAMLQVTVVDGKPTQVKSLQKVLNSSDVTGYPLTVDALLEKAADGVRGGGTVRGTYDPNGVPTQLTIDFVPNAVDDELSFGRVSFDPAP